MSQADQDKWDARYRAGEYKARAHPSALLAEWLPKLACPPDCSAIDVACGLGRNTLFLARQGWHVHALDISPVALAHLAAAAAQENLDITCRPVDLEPIPTGDVVSLPSAARQYDLALMVRYTNLPLVASLAHVTKPGGYIIVEEHLITDAAVVGPSNPRYRVAPGALRSAAPGLDILSYEEGLFVDPDGRTAALAQLIARRPPVEPGLKGSNPAR